MRSILIPAVCLAALAMPAMAQTSTPTPTRTSTQAERHEVQRVLYVCDTSEETQRAFRIEHGEVIYMTAEEVIAAQSSDDAWAAPRCITAAEAQRLERLRMDHANA